MAAARWEFQNCRQLQLQLFRRIQVVLKQKLHGAFPRFTSFAHESHHAAKRHGGKLKIKTVLGIGRISIFPCRLNFETFGLRRFLLD